MDPAAFSTTPTTLAVPIGAGCAHPDPISTEIGDVIHAEHRRILRLFGALDDVARRGEAGLSRSTLRQVWVRLADLLEHHTDAEEEICFPVLSGRGADVTALTKAAIADHNDIRAAVAEARFLEAGSARWWRAVTVAQDECTGHFSREERDLLAAFCDVMPHEASRKAVRQWETFTAARGAPPLVLP